MVPFRPEILNRKQQIMGRVLPQLEGSNSGFIRKSLPLFALLNQPQFDDNLNIIIQLNHLIASWYGNCSYIYSEY